jgi:cytochrome P450
MAEGYAARAYDRGMTVDAVSARTSRYPLGAAVTVEQLDADPHPVLARLRETEPVSWLPALGAWYVTRRDLALAVLRDADTFTVDDPRFSTARVVGRSMLSTDGAEHARHRAPFARRYRLDAVREELAAAVEAEAGALVGAVEAAGGADLRRALAGPLAVRVMAQALGLPHAEPADVLGWYADIVAAVTAITAGVGAGARADAAMAGLRDAVLPALAQGPAGTPLAAAAAAGLSDDEVVSNTAVLLFGGIETVEGTIANLLLHVLERPETLAELAAAPERVPEAVEESLRLEPAAAVVDRYATSDAEIAGARIAAGDLVTVSLAGANRDPAFFDDPDGFRLGRVNASQHLTFAQGPHVCLGMHLARIEAAAALRGVLALPGLRRDPRRPGRVGGLVFRKPDTVHALWG